MQQTENTTDRTGEITENCELLWGLIISNSPILKQNYNLSERAKLIYKQIKSFRTDYLKTHQQ